MNTEGLRFVCSCCVLAAVHHKPCGDPDHECTLTGDYKVIDSTSPVNGREVLFTCDGCNTTAEMTLYVLREV